MAVSLRFRKYNSLAGTAVRRCRLHRYMYGSGVAASRTSRQSRGARRFQSASLLCCDVLNEANEMHKKTDPPPVSPMFRRRGDLLVELREFHKTWPQDAR